jgi:hypothetical protein
VTGLELLRARVLPAAALLCCLLGLLGIHLPVVQGRFGSAGVESFGIGVGALPEVAVGLTLLVLVASVLPVIDLVRGGAVLTPALGIPAAVAAVPAWVITGLAGGLAGREGWLAYLVPRDAASVDIGPGAVLLPVSTIGLALVAAASFLVNRLDDGATDDGAGDDPDRRWADDPAPRPSRAPDPTVDPDL